MKHTTKILKALAGTNRLRIIKLLEKKRLCVCELAFILGITQPSVSRHLKKLKSAGLIGDEQKGLWTNYKIDIPSGHRESSLMRYINSRLKNDPIIKKDRKKAAAANRNKLCCKG
ncbi:MAG: metalloregulator ArsR/SmtB family transcription factor [Candidatus Omnitrophica bacterium]|jgi:ArsR family transcriptional regulator|nr:metalloregulator ArsR/SmtB family transcription factor [Candidatus Omnitrophota bacterium]